MRKTCHIKSNYVEEIDYKGIIYDYTTKRILFVILIYLLFSLKIGTMVIITNAYKKLFKLI